MDIPEYPKANKPATTNSAIEILEQAAELADLAGVNLPTLAESRENIARAKDTQQAALAIREDEGGLIQRITHDLADGKLDLDQAAAEITTAQALARGSVLQRAVAKVEGVAVNNALTNFGASVHEDALLKELRKVVDDTLTAIRKLRPALKDISSAEEATKAGTKQATAWATYVNELLPKWNAAHDLTDLMRRQHWIKPLPVEFHRDTLGSAGIRYAPRGPGWNSRVGRNDLRLEDLASAKRSGETIAVLLDERCDRWIPGGPYTEEEIRTFHKDIPTDEHEANTSRPKAVFA